jgi:hypothetical protein
MNKTRKITIIEPTKNKILDTETKKIIQYISVSVDLTKGKKYRCWWCTLFIENEPIGCPINVKRNNEKKEYSTDGVFCSFNCVKAYINIKEKTDMTYKHSHALLAHMVCDMQGSISPVFIEPAPHKCLLSDYGGHMTEDQYRHCFNRMLYIEKGIIKMFPVTSIYQEEEKLQSK